MTKTLLLSQLQACRNKKNWFVSFSDAAAGLTEEEALRKSGADQHSILELVNHLIFWNERYLLRFKNSMLPGMKGDNDATFACTYAWSEAVKRLDELMGEWEEQLSAAEEEQLQARVFKEREETWLDVLAQIPIHNAYHIGQMVSARKEQGSWKKEMGVS